MKHIELISIPVSDQQRAKTFYLKLGFEVLIEAPFGNDQQWIQMGIPGTPTSITLVSWFEKMPAGSVQGLLIATEDIEKDIKTWESRGIQVAPLENTPWGKFASVQDPDGNGWSLHQQ